MKFFKRKTKTRNGEAIYEGDKLCFINSDGEHCEGILKYSKKYKKLYFYNVLYNPQDYFSLKKCTCKTSHNSGYAVRAEYRPLPNCPTLHFGQLRIAATVVGNRRRKYANNKI